MVKIIDGSRMLDRASAHAELARALGFGPHYGRNLDALWDEVSTMDADAVLTGAVHMLNALDTYGCRILQVLFEASKGASSFHFTLQ